MDIAKIHQLFLESNGVQTDTRKDLRGKMFVALKGDNFDGNEFVKKAIVSGARYAISSDKEYVDTQNVIVVPDTLVTLQQLATYHRQQLDYPIIALTGSNGKTSTKELISSVLRTKYAVHHTAGNLNNHIGVPLTLLELTEGLDMAIIEMGANHQKEIEELCSIAQPTHGLITNIGKAHLEGFGGVEGVRKGKGEMYTFLKESGGVIFANASEQFLGEMVGDYQPCVQFNDDGWRSESRTYAVESLAGEYAGIKVSSGDTSLKSQSRLVGAYNYRNILMAVVLGEYFGVEIEKALEALNGFSLEMNRSQLKVLKGVEYILDAYNANPTSMNAALDHLESSHQEGCGVILGEMKELGEDSERYHTTLIQRLERSTSINQVVLIGAAFQKLGMPDAFMSFESVEEAKRLRAELEQKAKVWLIKGSRSNRLEKWLED